MTTQQHDAHKPTQRNALPDHIRRFLSTRGQHLDLGDPDNAEITPLPKGVWNTSYLVSTTSGHRLVFKCYMPARAILMENSPDDEFRTLTVLAPRCLAPLPVFFQLASTDCPFPLLVYHYVEGSSFSPSPPVLKAVAHLFARLHSLEPTTAPFLRRRDDLPHRILREIDSMLAYCRAHVKSLPDSLDDVQDCYEQIACRVPASAAARYRPSILHADPVPSNLVVKGGQIQLIDWQSPLISDPAFDIHHFLSSSFIQWDLAAPLTPSERGLFLTEYCQLTGDAQLEARIRDKRPFYLLQFALHCLIRYSEYVSGALPSELQQGRATQFEKYNKARLTALAELRQALCNRADW